MQSYPTNRIKIMTNVPTVIDRPFAIFVIAVDSNGYFAATTRESGKIGLPGGKVDDGEHFIEAAKREAFEEGFLVDVPDQEPCHIDTVDGKMVYWVKGYNPIALADYKEKYRNIVPIFVDRETIASSGFGNQFLTDFGV